MATFRQYKNKKWEYRIRYTDPITGKYKEKSKKGFRSKPEARLAAAEVEKELYYGLEVDDTPIPLKSFLYDWLNEFKKDMVRKNTFIQHEQSIKKHILSYFKNISIQEVKPMMYQRFINYLSKEAYNGKGYSRRTVQIIHGTMYSAMERAVMLKKIRENPCKNVVISTKKSRKSDRELEYISSEDIPAFLKAAYQYGYIYYLFFKTLINTGMRKGEAAALQWVDIDLKKRTIDINKTLDFTAKNKDELFGDPKTFTSKGIISISKSTANDLQELKKWQNNNKLILNDLYDHELNLVFARQDGSHLPKSTLFNAFERILKRAGLENLPIHSTRHTHAVLLLEADASMKYIQTRLRHKSIEVTSDTYSHISKKIEEDTIDKYDQHISSIMD